MKNQPEDLKLEDCVNDTCPWSGDPVQADSLTVFDGRVFGFCNPGCRDQFETAIRHFESSLANRDPQPAASGSI